MHVVGGALAVIVLLFAYFSFVNPQQTPQPLKPVLQAVQQHPAESAATVEALTAILGLFPADVVAAAPALGDSAPEIDAVTAWVRSHLGDLSLDDLSRVLQILSELGQ